MFGVGVSTVFGGRFVRFGWICGSGVVGMMSRCCGWLVVIICEVGLIGFGII